MGNTSVFWNHAACAWRAFAMSGATSGESTPCSPMPASISPATSISASFAPFVSVAFAGFGISSRCSLSFSTHVTPAGSTPYSELEQAARPNAGRPGVGADADPLSGDVPRRLDAGLHVAEDRPVRERPHREHRYGGERPAQLPELEIGDDGHFGGVELEVLDHAVEQTRHRRDLNAFERNPRGARLSRP